MLNWLNWNSSTLFPCILCVSLHWSRLSVFSRSQEFKWKPSDYRSAEPISTAGWTRNTVSADKFQIVCSQLGYKKRLTITLMCQHGINPVSLPLWLSSPGALTLSLPLHYLWKMVPLLHPLQLIRARWYENHCLDITMEHFVAIAKSF